MSILSLSFVFFMIDQQKHNAVTAFLHYLSLFHRIWSQFQHYLTSKSIHWITHSYIITYFYLHRIVLHHFFLDIHDICLRIIWGYFESNVNRQQVSNRQTTLYNLVAKHSTFAEVGKSDCQILLHRLACRSVSLFSIVRFIYTASNICFI